MELAKVHTKQTHKGNLLHLQTGQNGKSLKSCFAWNCKGTHQAKAQREIYCTPNRQSGKDLKSCFAWNWQTHKGNLLHSNQTKRQRLKSCFTWNYKATTKQTHKGKFIAHQTKQSGKGLKSCFAWNCKDTH